MELLRYGGSRTRAGNGFAILEVLVAFIILATTIFFAMQIMPTTTRAVVKTREYELASHIAHYQLEQMMYQGYNALTCNTYPCTLYSDTYSNVTSVSNSYVYQYDFAYQVDIYVPSTTQTAAALKTVLVTVTWWNPLHTSKQNGVKHTVQVQTMLGN